MDEEKILAYVEVRDNFTAEEVANLFKQIGRCIKEGTPASYFSQAIDKLVGNEMEERDEDLEARWQETYDDV